MQHQAEGACIGACRHPPISRQPARPSVWGATTARVAMSGCSPLVAALLAVLGSGCTLSVGAQAHQKNTRQLRHRYVTVEIGDATCDVTKYGAIGDGKTDVGTALLLCPRPLKCWPAGCDSCSVGSRRTLPTSKEPSTRVPARAVALSFSRLRTLTWSTPSTSMDPIWN